MKITQIVPSQWRGDQGQPQTSVLGLGADNQIYRWNRKKCLWELWTTESKRKPVEDDLF